jgi:hypothetical protein
MKTLLVPVTALFWLLAAPAAAQDPATGPSPVDEEPVRSSEAAPEEAPPAEAAAPPLAAAAAPVEAKAAAPAAPAAKKPPIVLDGAETPGDGADATEETAPVPHRLGIEFGMRLLVVDDPSLDPYTASNVVPQAMLALTYTPLSVGPAAFGVATEYDFGRIGGDIRGSKTSLAMHRFAGGLQAEVELWRFQLYARGMAGALHALGSISDSSAGGDLESAAWTWVADASGGVRFRLGSAGPAEDPAISFWLLAEGGYSFAGDMAMAFAPALEDDDPRQVGAVELPPLYPAGGTARFAFTLSFL